MAGQQQNLHNNGLGIVSGIPKDPSKGHDNLKQSYLSTQK